MTRYLLPFWQLRSCFLCGSLSNERTGLSIVYAAGPCQHSLSRVPVPCDSQPYFICSDLRLPFSSPPTIRRVKVEALEPASTGRYVAYKTKSKSKSHCDWRSVSESVSLGVEPHLRLVTRYLVLFDCYGLVFFCGAPSLTRGRVCLLSESLPALVSHLL
jgi:hypothetical protein